MARGCGKGQDRILVPDLGNDEVFSFQIQESSLTKIGAFRLNAGDGPRHLEFHPSRNFAYVVAELSCTVTVCRCDPSSGELTKLKKLAKEIIDTQEKEIQLMKSML
jgi:6-phosphogluconolactonase (cycloisomerase 2 family)